MNAKISFIGAGNMALSLIKGLIASGYDKHQLLATDPAADKQRDLSQSLGIECLGDNVEAVNQADVVVIAVKPQVLQNVCEEIAEAVQENAPLVISVAAGVRSADINQWLGGGVAIVRTMPNTPALIQSGATGLFANPQVDAEQKEMAEHILRAAGITVWVEQESDLDIVTAVSGSGPAYYFLFMEAMQAAAETMGLPAKTAKLLTIQTAFGAAKMALESAEECHTLRQRVTSPNGTTEKAIQQFEQAELPKIVAEAMQAAQRRAIELADELGANPSHQLGEK